MTRTKKLIRFGWNGETIKIIDRDSIKAGTMSVLEFNWSNLFEATPA